MKIYCFNGKRLAELIKTHHSAKAYLSDDELIEVINGLKEIIDFCEVAQLLPVANYYQTMLMSFKTQKFHRELN